jgi:hypothetical protein
MPNNDVVLSWPRGCSTCSVHTRAMTRWRGPLRIIVIIGQERLPSWNGRAYLVWPGLACRALALPLLAAHASLSPLVPVTASDRPIHHHHSLDGATRDKTEQSSAVHSTYALNTSPNLSRVPKVHSHHIHATILPTPQRPNQSPTPRPFRPHSRPSTLPYSAISISFRWLRPRRLLRPLSGLARLCLINTLRRASVFASPRSLWKFLSLSRPPSPLG